MANDINLYPPLIVETPITVPAGSQGMTSVPSGLVNPSRGPILVDEIRFAGINTYRMNTRATITAGRIQLCNDVPLTLLCKPLDRFLDGNPPAAFGPFEDLLPSVIQQSYVWRFPRPLLLLPTAQITVSLRTRIIYNPSPALTLSGLVSMIGRTLPEDFPIPKIISIPYAAHWTNATAAIASSSSANLKNPFSTNLRVRRFTTDFGHDNPGGEYIDPYGLATGTKIRIYGQNALVGVRDLTPPGVVMEFGRRSWTVDSILAPNGYFIVEFTTPNPLTWDGILGNRCFGISMVGVHDDSPLLLGAQ